MSAGHKRGAGGGSASGSGPGQGSQRGSQSPAQHPPLTDRTADKGKQPAGGSDDQASSSKDKMPEAPKEITAQELKKLVDLPPGAFRTGDSDPEFTKRPGYNNDFVATVNLLVNMYQVTELPEAQDSVFQFSVLAAPNPKDSKTLAKRLWDSDTVQKWLKEHSKKLGRWIYDGRAMAWSLDPLPKEGVKIPVILPKKQQNSSTSKGGKGGKDPQAPDRFTLTIKPTTSFTLNQLDDYLTSKPGSKWDDVTTRQFNFLDHLLREGRSKDLTPIRRSFYSKRPQFSKKLGQHTQVITGTYAAFRPMHPMNPEHIRMCVNVDVAHTAFWNHRSTLHAAAMDMLLKSDFDGKCYGADWILEYLTDHDRVAQVNWQNVTQQLKPVRRGTDICMSEAFHMLRRLERTKFTIAHGKADKDKIYTVGSIFFDAKKYPNGADATNVSFTKKREDGSQFSSTVEAHFRSIGKTLQHPEFPLIKTPHGEVYFPFEVCYFAPMQRYTSKLLPDEKPIPWKTSAMIKAAISRPDKRHSDITRSVKELKLDKDDYLKAFGVTINTEGGMLRAHGRILSRPALEFRTKLDVPESHRWNLNNIKFHEGKPLKNWMAINCDNTKTPADCREFFTTFLNVYKSHAGVAIDTQAKHIENLKIISDLTEQRIKEMYKILEGKAKKYQPDAPVQMVFFLLPKRHIKVYNRIKKVMDCDLKIPSQVMTWEKIDLQNSPNALSQYCSNVSLKVNAKLGGVNCYARPAGGNKTSGYFSTKTMFIGLDVSHAPPGTNEASMAALAVSIDPRAIKYGAACQTNGVRTEMVRPDTMKSLLPRFIHRWRKEHNTHERLKGGGPDHLYFFRDGVDAGQFRDVLRTEVQAIKETFIEEIQESPKITVIIVTKRHHVRMFNADPNKGSAASRKHFDKNDNPKPGLLVEQGATHPEYWDFFLTSHNAIQGTSRPIHYQVILDEIECNPNDLQRMIFHHCYQYCRSTLPVSFHPAAFYAHIVSKRAVAHLQPPAPPTAAGQLPDPLPLLPMRDSTLLRHESSSIEQVMWFV
ncbi:argonaute [Apiospora marii]|uniref:argonaute n=1 Tax=Apiospora marii TaxID=335849 RepID=UPI0031315D16